jgi:hypothetical protein
MLWRCSKLWRRQEALEMVEISGSSWRRSKGLEEVEGSGGSTARSSGDGRKLWRWSKALKAAAKSSEDRRLWMGWRRPKGSEGGSKL